MVSVWCAWTKVGTGAAPAGRHRGRGAVPRLGRRGRRGLDSPAVQPHARRLQVAGRTRPPEVRGGWAARAVQRARSAVVPPEPGSLARRAVARPPEVVVAVERAERDAVVPAERVARVARRQPGHPQRVVVGVRRHPERAVLGRVPGAGAALLQVDAQLVAAGGRRQLAEQLVAEPVVAGRLAESRSELRPRTIEEARRPVVPLDQQRNAVLCAAI